MLRSFVVLALIVLTGCQIPNRSGIEPDRPVQLDGTYISYNSELLGNNLLNYVGAVCVPGSDGKCGQRSWAAGRYLGGQQSPVVTPAQPNSSPSYRSIITANYQVAGNFPFIKPAGSSNSVNEVEMRTIATASAKDPETAFPGVDTLRRLLRANGVYAERVYWVQSASLIGMFTKAYSKVGSSLDVTGSGFGFNGTTFNEAGTSELQVLMGLDIREIDLRNIQSPAVPPVVAEPQRLQTDDEGKATFDLYRALRTGGNR